jgi:hypothetical protein
VDTVECQSCHRSGVPRLWHFSPFLGELRYMRTQHICPLCGSVMYESGGGIRPIGWLFLLFFGGLSGYIFLAINFPDANFSNFISIVFGLAFWGWICYKIYRHFK